MSAVITAIFGYEAQVRASNGKVAATAVHDTVPLKVRELSEAEAPVAFVERGWNWRRSGRIALHWREVDGRIYRPLLNEFSEPHPPMAQTGVDPFSAVDNTQQPYYPFRLPIRAGVGAAVTAASLDGRRGSKVLNSDRDYRIGLARGRSDDLIVVDGAPYAAVPEPSVASELPGRHGTFNPPGEPVWSVAVANVRGQGFVEVAVVEQGRYGSERRALFRADRKDEAIAFARRYAAALGLEARVDPESQIDIRTALNFDEDLSATLRLWEEVTSWVTLSGIGLDTLQFTGLRALADGQAAMQAALDGGALQGVFDAIETIIARIESSEIRRIAQLFNPDGPVALHRLRYPDGLAPERNPGHEDEAALRI